MSFVLLAKNKNFAVLHTVMPIFLKKRCLCKQT